MVPLKKTKEMIWKSLISQEHDLGMVDSHGFFHIFVEEFINLAIRWDPLVAIEMGLKSHRLSLYHLISTRKPSYWSCF